MRRLLVPTLCGLVGLLLLSPPHAYALTESIYDDFESGLINPDKWYGGQGDPGADTPTAEVARLIIPTPQNPTNHALALVQFAYGSTADNVGLAPGNTTRLRLSQNPNAIVLLQADVTIQSVLTQPSAANMNNGPRARAQLHGAFFNDGTSSGPGDETGDIFATIQMVQDSLTGLQTIEAFFSRCTDSECNNSTTTNAPAFTTTWAVGETHTLVAWWDPANKRFIFVVDPFGPAPEAHGLGYTFATTNVPGFGLKELRVRSTGANCTAGRTLSAIFATFDNVVIGQ